MEKDFDGKDHALGVNDRVGWGLPRFFALPFFRFGLPFHSSVIFTCEQSL